MAKSLHPAHPEMLSKFTAWWQQNLAGGWACRWRRRSVWTAQIMQKLGYEREVSAPLFWGESMRVITNETVSRSLLTFGYAEPTITALMLVLLHKGDSMVDIGTHFGYEALLGCELVGEAGSIIGFEPNPSVFDLARRNLYKHPQARLVQKAIADHAGLAQFQVRPLSMSAFGSISTEEKVDTFEVAIDLLDAQLSARQRPINFIKCDAEGYEMPVLRGATNIISNDRPVLILEADMPDSNGKASPRAYELAAYLEKFEYQAFNFDFDGEFKFGKLDAFPIHHANVAFLPKERTDLLANAGYGMF